MKLFVLFSNLLAQGGIQAIIDNDAPNLAVMGMSVVFSGLVILTISLLLLDGGIRSFRNLGNSLFGKGVEKKKDGGNGAPVRRMTGEEAAAVCLTIILYKRMHMAEYREKLTTESRLKMLSPWALSGKIHPTRKPTKW